MAKQVPFVSVGTGNLELVTSFDHGSESSKVVISVLQYGTEMKAFHTLYCGGTRCSDINFLSCFSSVQRDCMEMSSLSMLFLKILRFSC